MKVDLSISHQVLDRIKESGDHLGDTIYRPGEDRSFKGGALGHLVQQGESVPEPEIEPISAELLIKQPHEERVELPQLVAAPVSDFSEQEVKQLESEIVQLKERIDGVPSALDEMRGEIGRLVANSRREQTRIGKRMDQLEQRGGEVEPTEIASPQMDEMQQQLADLQQKMDKLDQQPAEVLQQSTNPLNEEMPDEVVQRFVRLEVMLQQSEQRVETLQQQQVEQTQLMAQLQEALEQTQQLLTEQSRQNSEQSARMQAMQQQIEGVEKGQKDSSNEQTEPPIELLLEPLKQRLVVLEQSHQQLSERLEQATQTRETTVVDEAPLKQGDGREQSIVEELRYEIGEVRKSSNRQLDALNSKLHAVTTSAEVNQIVKHATLQLQHKIDDIKQQIKQSNQPVSTAIRF